MARFLFLLHENPATVAHLDSADYQQLVECCSAWGTKLAAAGAVRGGETLVDEGGRHLRRTNGALQVTDSPYNETKEIVGGLWTHDATDDEIRLACATTRGFMRRVRTWRDAWAIARAPSPTTMRRWR